MRRKDKEITDVEAIHAFLAEARICRIGMVDGDRPYIVPMCFGYSDNALYLHSALKGKKIEALHKQPNVCFEVDTLFDTISSDDACDWSMRYKSVIGFGAAVFIEDPEEKRKALGIIMRRYTDTAFEFPENKIRATAVLRVDIQNMTGKASGF